MSRYILVVAFGRWAPHGGVPLAAVAKAVVEREAGRMAEAMAAATRD